MKVSIYRYNPETDREPSMKEYEVDPEPIGAGAFGSVRHCHFGLERRTHLVMWKVS